MDKKPEALPSYDEAADRPIDKEVILPTILVLSLQSIYAGSDPSVTLYRLNRGVANLGQATSEVEFERIEHTTTSGDGGEPRIKKRPRHIYTLRHATSLLQRGGTSTTAAYFIKAVSKHATAGHIGLKESCLQPTSSPSRHWLAVPVKLSGGSDRGSLPPFVSGAAPVFDIQRQQGSYKWAEGGTNSTNTKRTNSTNNSNGDGIAVEYDADNQNRLIITAALPRDMMDALVALWCCRVWQASVEREQSQPPVVPRKLFNSYAETSFFKKFL